MYQKYSRPEICSILRGVLGQKYIGKNAVCYLAQYNKDLFAFYHNVSLY